MRYDRLTGRSGQLTHSEILDSVKAERGEIGAFSDESTDGDAPASRTVVSADHVGVRDGGGELASLYVGNAFFVSKSVIGRWIGLIGMLCVGGKKGEEEEEGGEVAEGRALEKSVLRFGSENARRLREGVEGSAIEVRKDGREELGG